MTYNIHKIFIFVYCSIHLKKEDCVFHVSCEKHQQEVHKKRIHTQEKADLILLASNRVRAVCVFKEMCYPLGKKRNKYVKYGVCCILILTCVNG